MIALPGFLPAELGPGARGGFTSRSGGVSTGPYAAPEGGGLDLGTHVGDDPAAVRANRERLAEAVGRPVTWMRQVHGAEVRILGSAAVEASGHGEGPWPGEGPAADAAPGRSAVVVEAGECDALAAPPGDRTALAVMVADCVPVLLADPTGRVAAAHVGRPGLVRGVVDAVVGALESLGADPGELRAALGPSVCGRCYEVPAAMREEVSASHPATVSTTSWGTPALDLPAGVRAALARLGLREIAGPPACTLEDERYYSHRRAGRGPGPQATGRFAGVVWSVRR